MFGYNRIKAYFVSKPRGFFDKWVLGLVFLAFSAFGWFLPDIVHLMIPLFEWAFPDPDGWRLFFFWWIGTMLILLLIWWADDFETF